MQGLVLLVLCLTRVIAQDLDNVTMDVSTLERHLELYNGETLARAWPELQGLLGATCKAHLSTYLTGLRHGAKWALKMDDASGRYSTGWFWGNSYWMGSKTLCDNIAPDQPLKAIINGSSDVVYDAGRVRRNARASLVTTTLSPSSWFGYDPGRTLENEAALPFPVAFFSLRIKLNVSTMVWPGGERALSVGACLPWSCSETDARIIYTHLPARPAVLAIRSPHQHYRLQDDATFRVLAGATIALVILLAAGTTYDTYLRHDRKHRRQDVEKQYNLATHVKLDVNLPELKVNNGKSAMYVVNNNNQGSEESIEESSTVSSEDDDNPDVTKILSDMLLSFSIRTNWRQICEKSVGSDTISTIHGLRAISMGWVILGHTCIVSFKYSDNMDYRKLVEKQFLFQTVTNGALSVDTFFFISGLLVSFLYFRTNAKGKLDPLTRGSKGFTAGCLHFVGLLCYRFARLTAPYLYVLGVVEISMKWFHYNSIFDPPTQDHINCPNYWWRNVLYINTLFPVEQMCMLWSWYLSDDTQFYVVGAIILILANSHFKSACGFTIMLLISSWGTTGYISYANGHLARTDDPLALFDKVYDKPWTRLGPYLIGMAAGWALFKCGGKPKISWGWAVAGWTASSAMLLALVFGLHGATPGPAVSALHGALSHSAWAVALAWIVLACAAGKGGLVTKLLACPALYPFSRVTYCAYLVHPIVLRILAMQLDAPLHLDAGAMAFMFLGQVVGSYSISFLISLAVEAPVVTMLKILTQFKVKK